MRIVRLANFVTVHTGGLRTALRQLGRGYEAAGHEAILVIPGRRYSDKMTKQGRVITLPSAPLPRTGGYRVLAGRRELVKLLDSLEPDRIEVSDRTTLRWTGTWARQRGVRSMMVSHESLAGLLGVWGMPKRDALADRFNRRTAEAFDTIVCTTAFAAAEFRRIGVPNLVEVPLGVDLKLFHPSKMDVGVRSRYARPDELLLVYCSRLSAAKRPELAVDTVASLRNGKVPAVLVMAGDGTRRTALAYRGARLPVRFAGHISERPAVAALLASADVVLSPGPVETFGLATMEAMACGTPVVVNEQSALPEVVGDGGVAAAGTAEAFAAAVSRLMERPRVERRGAARAQAEKYSWPKSVEGFLRAHEAIAASATAPAPIPLSAPVSAPMTALIRPAVPSPAYLNGVPAPRRMNPQVREAGVDEAGAPRYA